MLGYGRLTHKGSRRPSWGAVLDQWLRPVRVYLCHRGQPSIHVSTPLVAPVNDAAASSGSRTGTSIRRPRGPNSRVRRYGHAIAGSGFVVNRCGGVGRGLPGRAPSWVPALVYAEAGDDYGGFLVEEQLEVVWRIIEVYCTEAYQVVTVGTQVVDGLGEARRRDPPLAGVLLASGVERHECGRRLGVLGDPESTTGQDRTATGHVSLAVVLKQPGKAIAIHA